MATLPVKTIATDLRANGIPANVSNSLSTYLCNLMMYTVLHLVAEKDPKTRAGFIHVPAHPAFASRQNYSFVEMPSINTELMTAAAKNAIRTSTAVDCDHREPTFDY